MTIRAKDLIGFSCRYHRNGICGAEFHACAFTFQGRAMRAVVFEGEAQCAVLSDDIDERWRGDHFADALREMIAASDESGASFRRAIR